MTLELTREKIVESATNAIIHCYMNTNLNHISTQYLQEILHKDQIPITYSLFDTCSNNNFITKALANALGLSRTKCSISIGELNNVNTITKHVVKAIIRSRDSKYNVR